jgi:hypothetical protein
MPGWGTKGGGSLRPREECRPGVSEGRSRIGPDRSLARNDQLGQMPTGAPVGPRPTPVPAQGSPGASTPFDNRR